MRFIYLITILFSLSGCLLLSDTNSQPKETLTDKAQKTILSYNNSLFLEKFRYETYYFSKLTQHKPKEIRELEQLFEKKENLPTRRREFSRSEYDDEVNATDSLIDIKRYEIKNNKINSKYSMEHIFVLKKGTENTKNYEEKVIEARYFLNHTLDSIINVEASMNAEIPELLSGTFETFFFEDALHYSDDYNADRNSDESFYLFFKDRLSSFEELQEKSNFLLHSLFVTKLTQKNKKYIPEQIGLLLANQIIKDSYPIEYKETLRTSQLMALYDPENEEEIIGYEIFVEALLGEEAQKSCFYINFNPWLEVVKFEEVPAPYEEYF